MDFYTNLDKICKEKKTSISAVLSKCGFSKSYGTNWKNGTSPNSNVITVLSNYLNVSIEYLLTGEEYNSDNKIILSNEEKEFINEFRYLSDKSKAEVINILKHLYDMEAATELSVPTRSKSSIPTRSIRHSIFKVSAGVGEWLSAPDEWENITICDTPQARKADFALTIEGDSMLPDYENGDIILVRKQSAVEVGQICIYTVDGYGYIKKFGGDRLISLNKKYNDIILKDYQNIICNGLVIGKV